MMTSGENVTAALRGFQTIFNQSHADTDVLWPKIATEVPSGGSEEDYMWLSSVPGMREWAGDRQISRLKGYSYRLTNVNFESTIEINRNDFEDDKLGLHTPKVKDLGQVSKQHQDSLVFTALKNSFDTVGPDGQNFIDTDHPNTDGSTQSNDGGGGGTGWFLMDLSKEIKPLLLQFRKKPEMVSRTNLTDDNVFMRNLYQFGVSDRKVAGYCRWQYIFGSKDTLNAANLKSAVSAMKAFTDDEGNYMNVRPTHLVVPTSLEFTARALLKPINDAGASNELADYVEMIDSIFLD
jgi:phage major head subunit gpT-like protein